MNKKQFKNKIKEIMLELLKDYELDEITTTGDIAVYSTPFAFGKMKKKRKKNIEKQTGYNFVSEALNDKDLKQINKLIRDVVGDIIRDIWLKRNAWK